MKKNGGWGCGGIIFAVMLIFAFATYIAGLILAFDVMIAIFFVSSVISYNNLRNMRASSMICPNCGSNNVMLSARKAGTTANAHYHYGFYNRESEIKYDRIGNCENCGFTWNYLTPADVISIQEGARERVIVFGAILALCAIFTWNLFGEEKIFNNEPTKSEYEKENSEESKSVWLDGYTDINDFDYYIEGGEIHIKDYEGDSEKIRIDSVYSIDGADYQVISFEDATFLSADAISIVIPEGTKYLDAPTFNSCGARYIYLPSTLEKPDDYFWSYFFKVDKIYYGGSEEQWKSICAEKRSEIDVKQIIFDTNPDELM